MNKTIQKHFFIMLVAYLLPSIALAQNILGKTGSSQAVVNTANDGTTLDDAVTINTTGIQEWTVPANGTYTIEVYGAQGGRSYLLSSSTWYDGGKGAKMVGDFSLSQGDVLKIVVGQQGVEFGSGSRGAGGGGGTGHGTPYSYDRHVPIIFMGRGIKPGQYNEVSGPEDIAPTLAYISGFES